MPRLVLILALALAFAPSAAAECAWVLWSQTFITASMKEPQLTPMAAYGSKADCETRAREEHEKVKQERDDFEKEAAERGRSGRGMPFGVRLGVVCLPDTVDPRPRGKE